MIEREAKHAESGKQSYQEPTLVERQDLLQITEAGMIVVGISEAMGVD
jgi:hypothetical protein